MNNENKHIGNHDSMEASSNLVCFYSFDIIVSDLWLWSLSCFLQREASLFQAKNQIEEAFGRANHRWRICRFMEGRIYRALVLEGLPGAVGSIEGTRVLWNQDMSWLANFDDIVWMVGSYLIIEWCIYFCCPVGNRYLLCKFGDKGLLQYLLHNFKTVCLEFKLPSIRLICNYSRKLFTNYLRIDVSLQI